MADPIVVQRVRGPTASGFMCSAFLSVHMSYLSEAQAAEYLPVDLMAHLPGGSLACVTVSCRVGTFKGQCIPVEVCITSTLWGKECDTWVRSTLLPRVEEAFIALVKADMPPIAGSEVEIVAYFAKGVEETVEMFAKYLGVMITARHEFHAGTRHADERAVRMAARQARQKAENEKQWWRRVMDFFFPETPHVPLPPPPRVLSKDMWSAQPEQFSSTFLGACEDAMGSLLRRVTIHDAKVAEFLQITEGVVFGESMTMLLDREKKHVVTRVHSNVFRRSPIFDDDDEVADLDAPSPRGVVSPTLYETLFTPRHK